MLIRLGIQGSQPLAGTATTEGGEPLRFEGWLDLLVVVSELVAAAPSSHEDADAAGWPDYQGRRPQVTSRSAAAQHMRDLAWLRRVRDRIDGTTPSR